MPMAWRSLHDKYWSSKATSEEKKGGGGDLRRPFSYAMTDWASCSQRSMAGIEVDWGVEEGRKKEENRKEKGDSHAR
jgi:hypothetical protein